METCTFTSRASILIAQVFKSIGDVKAGEMLYAEYSAVTEEEGAWLSLRDIVIARKMPRKMLVQPLTLLQGKSATPLSGGCGMEFVSHLSWQLWWIYKAAISRSIAQYSNEDI